MKTEAVFSGFITFVECAPYKKEHPTAICICEPLPSQPNPPKWQFRYLQTIDDEGNVIREE
jgi:hypothetical protein